MLRKALQDKLEKLAAAEADHRILLLELPTLDSDRKVIATIQDLTDGFPLLSRVDRIVVAKTLGYRSEGVVFFYVWDVTAKEYCQYLKASVVSG